MPASVIAGVLIRTAIAASAARPPSSNVSWSRSSSSINSAQAALWAAISLKISSGSSVAVLAGISLMLASASVRTQRGRKTLPPRLRSAQYLDSDDILMFHRSKWIDTKLLGVRAHKKAPRRKLYHPTRGLTDAIAGGQGKRPSQSQRVG